MRVFSTWKYCIPNAVETRIPGKMSQQNVEYVMNTYRRDSLDTMRRRTVESRSVRHTSNAINNSHENEERKL
jgi:hypothetical protein